MKPETDRLMVCNSISQTVHLVEFIEYVGVVILNSHDERGLFGKALSRHCPVARYCSEENIYFHTPNSISAISLE